jgi:hypothetical protein
MVLSMSDKLKEESGHPRRSLLHFRAHFFVVKAFRNPAAITPLIFQYCLEGRHLMTFWNDNTGIDEFVRASDRSLNVLVVVLLAAFALGSGAYYYGQMNPRIAPVSKVQTAPVAPPAQ